MSVNISDGSLNWRASIDLSGIKEQVGEINKMLGNVGGQLEKQSKDIDQFSRSAANAIKAYIGVTAIKGFVTDIVKVRGEFQQLEVAFQTMLGNKEKADALMSQVVDLAAKTPFGLQDAATGAKQLLAYGFAAENVTQNLTMLGDIASGVGSPLNDIVYLYGTLRTQGRAFQKDIMQFTGRGIPIIGELAKQFGVTEDKVSELVEAGKVGFPEIEKAFKSLTSEGGMFNNLMEAQSKTISGLIANFGDAWATMLNDIGKSQEGPIADIIKGGISIVENYEKVLDVLKVLVVSYGTYRAAVIATTVAQGIATSITKGWTAAQLLQYNALLISEKAMKLLNATMLTNPFVAVSTAVVALIGVLAAFNKTTDLVKGKQQLLQQQTEKLNDNLADQKAKITPLLQALKDQNTTEAQRVSIYKQLNEISPELVKGLDAQTLSYDALKNNVNAYLDALRDQMKLEANSAAIKESIVNVNSIQKQIEQQKKAIENAKAINESANKTGTYGASGLINATNVKEAEKQLSSLEDALKRQQKVTEELGQSGAELAKKNVAVHEWQKARTVEIIEQEIEEQRKRQNSLAPDSVGWRAMDEVIKRLEKEKEAITGNTEAAERQEDKYSAMLEKKAKALNDIAELERNANQSGLLQKQKDLDIINEKYDKQLQSVQEINKEIATYNAKNPNKQLSLLGADENSRINASRQLELTNYQYREDAKNYIESLDEKKQAFEKFEEAQESGSEQMVELVKSQYGLQLGEAKSYVESLKAQLASLVVKSTVAPLNLKEQLISEELKSKISEEEKKENDKRLENTRKLYAEILTDTESYSSKRLSIDKKYVDKFKVLESQKANYTDKQFSEVYKRLQELRVKEQQDLGDEILKNSEVYKEFSKGFNDETPKSIQKFIEKLEKFREEMKQFGFDVQEINKMIAEASQEKFASVLRSMSSYISAIGGDINLQLTDTLKITGQQLSQIIGNIETLFSSQSSKGAKNSSLIGLIYTVVDTLSSTLTTALQNESDLASGLEPSAAAANQITLAIEAQNKALERQSELLNDMYGQDKINGLLSLQDQLQKKQKETFDALKNLSIDGIVKQGEYYVDSLFHGKGEWARADTTAGKIFGILNDPFGFIPKTVRVELETIDTSSLSTIDDFISLLDEIKSNGGKLNGRTIVEDDVKALEELIANYEELEEKQKELKTQIQQIFTATTSDSIADSIIAGFKAGKRTIEDFSEDFEELMRNAVLNSLKYQTLEAPMQKFYEEFALKSGSDGILTGQEISELKDAYKQIIDAAGQQIDNLQSITDLNLTGEGSSPSSLAGAIKGMTEQQADLLAGQFGGLRMTAMQQLDTAMSSLDTLNRIQANTEQLYAVRDILRRLEMHGIKVV